MKNKFIHLVSSNSYFLNMLTLNSMSTSQINMYIFRLANVNKRGLAPSIIDVHNLIHDSLKISSLLITKEYLSKQDFHYHILISCTEEFSEYTYEFSFQKIFPEYILLKAEKVLFLNETLNYISQSVSLDDIIQGLHGYSETCYSYNVESFSCVSIGINLLDISFLVLDILSYSHFIIWKNRNPIIVINNSEILIDLSWRVSRELDNCSEILRRFILDQHPTNYILENYLDIIVEKDPSPNPINPISIFRDILFCLFIREGIYPHKLEKGDFFILRANPEKTKLICNLKELYIKALSGYFYCG